MNETWEIWFPDAGATGLPFARAEVDAGAAGDRVLVHAAPPTLSVVVRGEHGSPVASGESLERSTGGPMSCLRREGDRVTLEDIWPGDDELGLLVILAGGEAGILRSWWHADDHSEWRWQLELYNHT
jgi:hypothetical protein